MIKIGGIFTDYNKTYREAYDYHKRWNPCPSNPEEWDAAAREVAAIASQANNDPFLLDMLVAVYDEMERKYTERTNKCV